MTTFFEHMFLHSTHAAGMQDWRRMYEQNGVDLVTAWTQNIIVQRSLTQCKAELSAAQAEIIQQQQQLQQREQQRQQAEQHWEQQYQQWRQQEQQWQQQEQQWQQWQQDQQWQQPQPQQQQLKRQLQTVRQLQAVLMRPQTHKRQRLEAPRHYRLEEHLQPVSNRVAWPVFFSQRRYRARRVIPQLPAPLPPRDAFHSHPIAVDSPHFLEEDSSAAAEPASSAVPGPGTPASRSAGGSSSLPSTPVHPQGPVSAVTTGIGKAAGRVALFFGRIARLVPGVPRG